MADCRLIVIYMHRMASHAPSAMNSNSYNALYWCTSCFFSSDLIRLQANLCKCLLHIAKMQMPPETRVMVLQLWKGFRQYHHTLHRRLGYLALVATTLGSLSAAPYALSYLFSARLPETVSFACLWGLLSMRRLYYIYGFASI